MEIITKNAEETQAFGEKIGHDLANGKLKTKIFCLYGNLGSGKTTFIQGLAKGLGIKKRITSPTFMLIKQYEIRNTHYASRLLNFYHIDLYRIEKAKEAESLGLEEVFSNPEAVIAIEWAERITHLLTNKKTILPKVDIYFDYFSENQRKIRIVK